MTKKKLSKKEKAANLEIWECLNVQTKVWVELKEKIFEDACKNKKVNQEDINAIHYMTKTRDITSNLFI